MVHRQRSRHCHRLQLRRSRPPDELHHSSNPRTTRPLLEKGVIPVVTGFIAANQNGIVTTVGRGGSDYTATILGVALGADEIWIWTDVDGIMTTDPKIVPSAKMLPQLSYQEAAEMAIFGAKAMHPRALEPVIKENIPVRIRSVFHPENQGHIDN